MTHEEKALNYFSSNFNCSQSVLAAFSGEVGIEEKTALMLATNFGGGARKAEMCGAVSGALMVLGMMFGHCESENNDAKSRAYRISEQFMNRFIEKNGSVVCRDLLGYDLTLPDDKKIIAEKNLFKTRCPELIASAVQVLEEIISEN